MPYTTRQYDLFCECFYFCFRFAHLIGNYNQNMFAWKPLLPRLQSTQIEIWCAVSFSFVTLGVDVCCCFLEIRKTRWKDHTHTVERGARQPNRFSIRNMKQLGHLRFCLFGGIKSVRWAVCIIRSLKLIRHQKCTYAAVCAWKRVSDWVLWIAHAFYGVRFDRLFFFFLLIHFDWKFFIGSHFGVYLSLSLCI